MTDGDLISRKAVIDGINAYIEKAQYSGTIDDFISFEELVVKSLPAVKPLKKEQTDGDLISRQATIDALSHMCSEDENGITVSRANVNSMLKAMPPVTPQPSAEKTANKININEYVKVKLTDYGKEIFYHQYDNLNKTYGKEIIKPRFPTVDSDGYTSFQLWYFMNLYGRYIDMGLQNVIEPLEIVFESAEKTTEWNSEEEPVELKYIGYSSHDDESRYQCPVCKEGYGGWDFLNGSVRVMNGLFRCKCGKLLKKPE